MRVIVVGCGQFGSTLAYNLYKLGHEVVVIDQDEAAFDHLPVDFQGRTIEGDVLSKNTLHRAEASGAEALIAATGSDPLNALIAYVAETEYSVSNVMARNCDPRQQPLQEAFEIPIIGSAGWKAENLAEFLSASPLQTIYLNHNANFFIYRIVVPNDWTGRRLAELLPQSSRVLKIMRDGQNLEASEQQVVQSGDLIFVSSEAQEADTLKRLLGPGEEKKA